MEKTRLLSQSRRFVSALISLCLAIGLLPLFPVSFAYADTARGQTESAGTIEETAVVEDSAISSGRAGVDMPDVQASDQAETESDSTANEGLGLAEKAATDNAENVSDGSSENMDKISDVSAFEFIYVDKKELAIGEKQSIVVSFVDPDNAKDATLYYQNADKSISTVTANRVVDGAALFELSFSDTSDCGEYSLIKAAWQSPLKGEASISGDTGGGYSFSVGEEASENEGDALSVYSLDENGSLIEGPSLSGAVASACETQDAVSGSIDNQADSSSDDAVPLALPDSAEPRSANKMVVALDPGHGGSDSGATSGGLVEKDLNLKIARYCRDELEKYNDVTTVMTRDSDTYVGLQERVDKAVAAGADLFVSFHINATKGATGFEVWIQNDSKWRSYLHEESEQLGANILSKLSALGLKNRGNKESDSSSIKNPDGSNADKLAVLRGSRNANIPAVLIEHGFIDGSNADRILLSSEAGLKQMGVADAQAIAKNYSMTQGVPKWATVVGKAHVSSVGWMSDAYDGETIGTVGKNLSLEALRLGLTNGYESQGSVQVRAHVSGVGWQGWTSGTAGTTGQARAIEALQIKLTGELAALYDVWYRVHSADYGWLGWAKNGESAGSEGYAKSAQAVQVRLVAKGGAAPGPTSGAFKDKASEPTSIAYQAHVASIGWQSRVSSGSTAGTTGRNLSMEALRVSVVNAKGLGSVQVRAHVSGVGWQGWTSGTAGTTGQARAIEALQIKLTGELAALYDVWYRVHSADYGWLGWAKNGESAGSEGYAKSAQAVQVRLVAKGGAAPGPTSGAFKDKASDSSASQATVTPIMGASQKSVDRMVKCYEATGYKYPSSVYTSKGAPTIRDYCQIIYEEARAEDVRAEVLFGQVMWETGWLQFGGSVKPEQCNFGGLGATSSSVSGAVFGSVREGLRAQVQHLKAYASKEPLKYACVDPRFNLVNRGCAPNLEDLNGKWAVPGNDYGQNIRKIINRI